MNIQQSEAHPCSVSVGTHQLAHSKARSLQTRFLSIFSSLAALAPRKCNTQFSIPAQSGGLALEVVLGEDGLFLQTSAMLVRASPWSYWVLQKARMLALQSAERNRISRSERSERREMQRNEHFSSRSDEKCECAGLTDSWSMPSIPTEMFLIPNLRTGLCTRAELIEESRVSAYKRVRTSAES